MEQRNHDDVKYTPAAESPKHNVQLRGCGKASLIFLLACIVTFIISFTTSGWETGATSLTYNGEHWPSRNGLWETCGPVIERK